jgi:hypothetical protein
MNKRKLFMAGLVLVVLAPALIVLCTPRPATVWTMPDGSKLRLVKVTYGTNNFCAYGNRLRDLFYPFVPAKYRTNFNFQVATVTTGKMPGVVIWMERTGVPTNSVAQLPPGTFALIAAGSGTSMPGTASLGANYQFSVIEDSGAESLPITSHKWLFPDAYELEAIVLGQYPSPSLRIRIYPGAVNGSAVGEFRVPNEGIRPITPALVAERTGGSR